MQLREAARVVLAREGTAGLSARKVAAHAGVSPGLVHHYYGSMQDLVLDALLEHEGAHLGELAATSDPDQRIALIMDGLVCSDDDDDGCRTNWRVSLELWAWMTHDPAAADAWRRVEHAYTDLLTDALRRSPSRRCGDPEAAATILFAAADGFTARALARDSTLGQEQIRTLLATTLDSLAPTVGTRQRKAR